MIFEPEKVILTETVNGDFIQKIFKEAKNMKAEYVLVPRNLMQNTYLSSLIGLSHNAIVTHGVFSSLRDMVHYDLWKEQSLQWIMFMPKDMLSFNKMRKAIYGRDDLPLSLQMQFVRYIINGKAVSIAHKLIEIVDQSKLTIKGELEESMIPYYNLFPYDDALNKITAMVFQRDNGSQIVWHQDVTNDEELNKILASKAGVGSFPWYPEVEGLPKQHPYFIYMTSNLLNVNKGDKIEFNLYNHLPSRDASYFLSEFNVSKPKKGCIITTLMLHMIMI